MKAIWGSYFLCRELSYQFNFFTVWMSLQISFWSCFDDSCLSRNVFLSSQLLSLSIGKCLHHSFGSFWSLWSTELSDSTSVCSSAWVFHSCPVTCFCDETVFSSGPNGSMTEAKIMGICSLGIKKASFGFFGFFWDPPVVLLKARGLWRRENGGFLHFLSFKKEPLTFPSRQNQVLVLEFSTHPRDLGCLAVHCLGSRDAVGLKKKNASSWPRNGV